ncbi:hypothetical protein BDZ45DRAFT_803097 [Acephala macrosclerotiorum]|nr:hypothetical protein BDZ45DRAFT_803097 [Acephala macrosclerotiorum]
MIPVDSLVANFQSSIVSSLMSKKHPSLNHALFRLYRQGQHHGNASPSTIGGLSIREALWLIFLNGLALFLSLLLRNDSTRDGGKVAKIGRICFLLCTAQTCFVLCITGAEVLNSPRIFNSFWEMVRQVLFLSWSGFVGWGVASWYWTRWEGENWLPAGLETPDYAQDGKLVVPVRFPRERRKRRRPSIRKLDMSDVNIRLRKLKRNSLDVEGTSKREWRGILIG